LRLKYTNPSFATVSVNGGGSSDGRSGSITSAVPSATLKHRRCRININNTDLVMMLSDFLKNSINSIYKYKESNIFM
jgi:hypothetical protein